ncbi:hypothetical protein MBOL_39460 [Mycobacteroides abscessus subsp. bolletii BD]|nr:hypothetical protein MBOL_39460 [Mycobacteroides abscessus subsp. bolletii BD]
MPGCSWQAQDFSEIPRIGVIRRTRHERSAATNRRRSPPAAGPGCSWIPHDLLDLPSPDSFGCNVQPPMRCSNGCEVKPTLSRSARADQTRHRVVLVFLRAGGGNDLLLPTAPGHHRRPILHAHSASRNRADTHPDRLRDRAAADRAPRRYRGSTSAHRRPDRTARGGATRHRDITQRVDVPTEHHHTGRTRCGDPGDGHLHGGTRRTGTTRVGSRGRHRRHHQRNTPGAHHIRSTI